MEAQWKRSGSAVEAQWTGGELQARCVVAAEGLKPQISPTRKKMVTCFPPLHQRSGSAVAAQWKRSGCAADAQRMRSGCAADAQRMRSGCAAAGGVKTTLL